MWLRLSSVISPLSRPIFCQDWHILVFRLAEPTRETYTVDCSACPWQGCQICSSHVVLFPRYVTRSRRFIWHLWRFCRDFLRWEKAGDVISGEDVWLRQSRCHGTWPAHFAADTECTTHTQLTMRVMELGRNSFAYNIIPVSLVCNFGWLKSMLYVFAEALRVPPNQIDRRYKIYLQFPKNTE